jgi:hypothetical protein
LDIVPSSGPIGTVYTLTLENFKPNEDVIIERTHLPTGEVTFITLITVDEMGNGTVQFVSQPGDELGTYIVAVRGIAGTLIFGQFEIN